MRRKIGPGQWEDLGPGFAGGARGSGLTGNGNLGALPLGQMIPDARVGPMPIVKGQTTQNGTRMGIARRRPAPMHVHREPKAVVPRQRRELQPWELPRVVE